MGFFSLIKTYNLISKVTVSHCVDVTGTQSITIQLILGNFETVISFGIESTKCSPAFYCFTGEVRHLTGIFLRKVVG